MRIISWTKQNYENIFMYVVLIGMFVFMAIYSKHHQENKTRGYARNESKA